MLALLTMAREAPRPGASGSPGRGEGPEIVEAEPSLDVGDLVHDPRALEAREEVLLLQLLVVLLEELPDDAGRAAEGLEGQGPADLGPADALVVELSWMVEARQDGE